MVATAWGSKIFQNAMKRGIPKVFAASICPTGTLKNPERSISAK